MYWPMQLLSEQQHVAAEGFVEGDRSTVTTPITRRAWRPGEQVQRFGDFHYWDHGERDWPRVIAKSLYCDSPGYALRRARSCCGNTCPEVIIDPPGCEVNRGRDQISSPTRRTTAAGMRGPAAPEDRPGRVDPLGWEPGRVFNDQKPDLAWSAQSWCRPSSSGSTSPVFASGARR